MKAKYFTLNQNHVFEANIFQSDLANAIIESLRYAALGPNCCFTSSATSECQAKFKIDVGIRPKSVRDDLKILFSNNWLELKNATLPNGHSVMIYLPMLF